MSDLRFMSPYLKGGGDSARRANRIRYFATRPGVEVLSDGGSQPATKKQKAYIQRLLRAFPDARELLEYEDYLKNQTQESASEFIRQAREDFAVPMSQRENYLDYVSHRPGVELRGEHGLWTSGGKVENLSEAVREVAEHPGNVWTPVVAIRRQDAERLGYDNAENWRALVNASLCDIAKGYKIHPDHLRWYAAFHEKEKSVHIHMVVFSSDPKEGYLTPDGIRQVKSAFARRIFQQDLMHIYEQKTAYRNQLQQNAAEAMQELIRQMRDGTLENPQLEDQIEALARRLRTVRGKKVYGYLKKPVKMQVDAIVDELAKESNIPMAVGPSLTFASKFELQNKSWETPGVLAKAGCHVSIITDNSVIPQQYLPLCAGMAVKAGMDPFAALQAITINPAKHIGIADRVGSIEVGKDADLVLTDGCPFEIMTNVKAVLINGAVVSQK